MNRHDARQEDKIDVSIIGRTDLKRKTYADVIVELNDIYESKNRDYGDSFGKSIQEFGPLAFVVRASDKMERIKNLVHSQAVVKDESLTDTVRDLANYCVMFLMEVDND